MSALFWITGLSGAGKTSLGESLYLNFKKKNKGVVFLDGDLLRGVFKIDNSCENNFSKESRLELAKMYINLCKVLYDQDLIVIFSTISMFHEIYSLNRKIFTNYYEIFIDIDLETLYSRDPKGIYKKYKEGKVKNVLGLDLKFDRPKNPNIIFNKKDSIKGIRWMTDEVIRLSKLNFK